MRKKIWIIITAVLLVAAMGTTVALAADDEGTWRGFRRVDSIEDMVENHLEDGTLTQEEADLILAGEADIHDFIDRDEMYGGRMFDEDDFWGNGYRQGGVPEEVLDAFVEEGILTQAQADEVAAGEALLSDYVDEEDCIGIYDGDGDGYGSMGGRGFDSTERGRGHGCLVD